jgi:hypothetical protein
MGTCTVLGLGVVLSACSVTQPVSSSPIKGRRCGEARRPPQAVDRSQRPMGNCSGAYDSLSLEKTITMPVLCSDGRKGIVIATRDSNGQAGHGTVQLTDGTKGTFIFGPSAANF